MTRETTMEQDRRTFLKTTTPRRQLRKPAGRDEAVAQTAPRASELKELPKGLTFATLRRPTAWSRRCAPIAAFSTSPPPNRISARTRPPPSRGAQGPRATSPACGASSRRRAPAPADRYFVARRQGRVRPLRDQSGEDRLHRPQLPQAHCRDRQSGAGAAGPVQQVQHRAQPSRRRHRACRGRTPRASTTRPSW